MRRPLTRGQEGKLWVQFPPAMSVVERLACTLGIEPRSFVSGTKVTVQLRWASVGETVRRERRQGPPQGEAPDGAIAEAPGPRGPGRGDLGGRCRLQQEEVETRGRPRDGQPITLVTIQGRDARYPVALGDRDEDLERAAGRDQTGDTAQDRRSPAQHAL